MVHWDADDAKIYEARSRFLDAVKGLRQVKGDYQRGLVAMRELTEAQDTEMKALWEYERVLDLAAEHKHSG
jgi:hypothetical protein